jgi:hypothetical protein
MDVLTRERYPHPIPWKERLARPRPLRRARACGEPVDPAVIRRRRLILCGTDDLTLQLQGGDPAELARVGERRVVEAIRTHRARRVA